MEAAARLLLSPPSLTLGWHALVTALAVGAALRPTRRGAALLVAAHAVGLGGNLLLRKHYRAV